MDAKCGELRPLLKEINNDFDIDFNYETETYTVYHNGFFYLSVPYGKFTRKTFEDIRRNVYININGEVFKDIDEHNAKIEQQKEREIKNLAEDLAKDLRPILNKVV